MYVGLSVYVCISVSPCVVCVRACVCVCVCVCVSVFGASSDRSHILGYIFVSLGFTCFGIQE